MYNLFLRNSLFAVFIAACIAPTLLIADDNEASTGTTELLIKFDAMGASIGMDPVTGESSYSINATGFKPEIMDNGVVNRKASDESPIAIINDAIITFEYFDFNAPPATVNFTCQGCNLSFADGSVLESDPIVPLIGRALFAYGPVPTNNANGISTIRMMGCAGLKETAGVGKYANMLGSICFNGVFDFDMSNPPQSLASITGASNCTITLHMPQQLTALP